MGSISTQVAVLFAESAPRNDNPRYGCGPHECGRSVFLFSGRY